MPLDEVLPPLPSSEPEPEPQAEPDSKVAVARCVACGHDRDILRTQDGNAPACPCGNGTYWRL